VSLLISLHLSENETIAFIGDLHYDNHTPESRIDDIQVTLCEKLNSVLKSCLKKNVKHLFFEGDVFNRIACSHESINTLGNSLLQFIKNGITLYTILGNHDIVRNNLEHIEKSPIQTLFTFGVLKHINLQNLVEINNRVLITPVDYTETLKEAVKSYDYNILLAHVFYEQKGFLAEDKHNVTEKQLRELGYDYAFFGHDHEEYPLSYCDKCQVYRTGSVLRGTSHNYNFNRIPKFVVMSGFDSKLSCEVVEIPCKDYELVASEYSLNKKRLGSASGLQNVLSDLADKLSESNQSDGDRIYEIIKTDKNLPQDCRGLILKYIAEGGN